MDSNESLRDVAGLRFRFQMNNRLRLECLAALSKVFREWGEPISDHLLASLVLALPDELHGNGVASAEEVSAALPSGTPGTPPPGTPPPGTPPPGTPPPGKPGPGTPPPGKPGPGTPPPGKPGPGTPPPGTPPPGTPPPGKPGPGTPPPKPRGR